MLRVHAFLAKSTTGTCSVSTTLCCAYLKHKKMQNNTRKFKLLLSSPFQLELREAWTSEATARTANNTGVLELRKVCITNLGKLCKNMSMSVMNAE